MEFDSVGMRVGAAVKREQLGWSEENLEFVRKYLNHACAITYLRIFKKANVEIIPVPDGDCWDYTDEKERSRAIDIGGFLTRLKAELESEPEEQEKPCRFQGPHDLESDLGGGVKLRLCNLLFADKATVTCPLYPPSVLDRHLLEWNLE